MGSLEDVGQLISSDAWERARAARYKEWVRTLFMEEFGGPSPAGLPDWTEPPDPEAGHLGVRAPEGARVGCDTLESPAETAAPRVLAFRFRSSR
jgi:hypothetical protein